MGVRIDGVWHEELADPGGGTYDSPSAYNRDAAAASTQGGQNLNWGQGSGSSGSGSGANAGAGAQQYSSAIQKSLDALASGNREAFQRAIYEWDQAFGFDKEKFAEDVRQFNKSFGVTEAGLTGTYGGAQHAPGSFVRDPTNGAIYTVNPNGQMQWLSDPAQIPPGTPMQEVPGLTASLGGLSAQPVQQGAPTLPALTSYATQFGTWGVPQQGAQTLAAQGQYFNQGMEGIKTAAALQANPFRQQQVLGQLGGLYGGQGVAGFQAPNTVAGVGTAGGNARGGMGYMQQMIDDIKDPTANQTNMNQILDATPTPNKLNSADFLRAAPSTQNMVLQAMQEKYGLDPEDSVKQIKNTLPQFQAPSAMGGIRR